MQLPTLQSQSVTKILTSFCVTVLKLFCNCTDYLNTVTTSLRRLLGYTATDNSSHWGTIKFNARVIKKREGCRGFCFLLPFSVHPPHPSFSLHLFCVLYRVRGEGPVQMKQFSLRLILTKKRCRKKKRIIPEFTIQCIQVLRYLLL